MSSMVYIRGNRRDYDRWADLVDDSRWKYSEVLPVFNRSEANLGVRSQVTEGPVVGTVEARLYFNPLDKNDTTPVQTREGVFTFTDGDGRKIGTRVAVDFFVREDSRNCAGCH